MAGPVARTAWPLAMEKEDHDRIGRLTERLPALLLAFFMVGRTRLAVRARLLQTIVDIPELANIIVRSFTHPTVSKGSPGWWFMGISYKFTTLPTFGACACADEEPPIEGVTAMPVMSRLVKPVYRGDTQETPNKL